VQWLKEGDKNTKFFHAQTVKRRRRNAIQGLEEEDGSWSTDRYRIHEVVVQYFHSLFSSARVSNFNEIILCVPNKVGSLDNNFLCAPVSDMEIGYLPNVPY